MKASKKTKSHSSPAATKVGSDSVEVFVLEGGPAERTENDFISFNFFEFVLATTIIDSVVYARLKPEGL